MSVYRTAGPLVFKVSSHRLDMPQPLAYKESSFTPTPPRLQKGINPKVLVCGMCDKNVNLNMNYSFLTTMYEQDIGVHTVVKSHRAGKVTYHENF